jgi:hypothetical protein
MFGFPNSSEVERIKREYPEGTRISLISMQDPHSRLESGDRGTVVGVDDIGTVHMMWDRGGSLGLVYGEDRFRKLTPQELEQEKNSAVIEKSKRTNDLER